MWDRADDLAEAADLLSDSSTYKEVMFGEEEIVRFLKESNGMFKKLLSKSSISSEEHQYFSYGFKKSINLGKKCFYPKYIGGLIMFQVARLYQIMVHLLKWLHNL